MGGIAGGALFLVIIVLVIIVCVLVCKNRRRGHIKFVSGELHSINLIPILCVTLLVGMLYFVIMLSYNGYSCMLIFSQQLIVITFCACFLLLL